MARRAWQARPACHGGVRHHSAIARRRSPALRQIVAVDGQTCIRAASPEARRGRTTNHSAQRRHAPYCGTAGGCGGVSPAQRSGRQSAGGRHSCASQESAHARIGMRASLAQALQLPPARFPGQCAATGRRALGHGLIPPPGAKRRGAARWQRHGSRRDGGRHRRCVHGWHQPGRRDAVGRRRGRSMARRRQAGQARVKPLKGLSGTERGRSGVAAAGHTPTDIDTSAGGTRPRRANADCIDR